MWFWNLKEVNNPGKGPSYLFSSWFIFISVWKWQFSKQALILTNAFYWPLLQRADLGGYVEVSVENDLTIK